LALGVGAQGPMTSAKNA